MKNQARTPLNGAAKRAMMSRFVADCQRALRGGVTVEEMKAAVDEAASMDAIEEVQGS